MAAKDIQYTDVARKSLEAGVDKLAKKSSRIRVSFVTPIAPASMLSNRSRRCNANASMLCHRAATEDHDG